ncbi:MAG TPA: hypothetical protein DCS29_04450 [Candidatus Magasanikbacteria bacterium]|nr:MAG: hypothetical protein A2479_03505 [Candidatus Magasanikbacteria bacterium RIFOXYC2_FULL_39_8]HAT03991.1 hypothetical protein [Candidatus Magasanikbacteria bacterium]
MKKVLIFGTFDIVHAGHIHMFKEAREYGDCLVVSVAKDVNAEKIKGKAPFYNEHERVDFLKNIKIIDEVLMGDANDPYKNINTVKPDVIALGYDQKVYVDHLEDAITNMGLEIQIVRLAPYYEKRFKSKKLKKYIERIV